MPEADRTRLVPERGANDVLRVEATGEAVTLRTGHISSPDEVACLPWHRDHVRREEFRDCVMPEAYDVMPRQGSMSAEVRVRLRPVTPKAPLRRRAASRRHDPQTRGEPRRARARLREARRRIRVRARTRRRRASEFAFDEAGRRGSRRPAAFPPDPTQPS